MRFKLYFNNGESVIVKADKMEWDTNQDVVFYDYSYREIARFNGAHIAGYIKEEEE